MRYSVIPVVAGLLIVTGCSETDTSCNSENHCHYANGTATCDPGYTWQDPDDPHNHICVPYSNEAPVIAVFYAAPDSVLSGTTKDISWNWSYANSPDPDPVCSIDHGIGEVEQGEISSLVLSAPTTFTLTCTNSAGEDSAQASVSTVDPPSIAPEIATFSVSPDTVYEFEETLLSWNWSYANSPDPEPSCSIDQGVGKMEQGGISSLVLSGPTTFTLTCTNSAGEDSAQANVSTVGPPSIAPEIATFSVSPGTVYEFQETLISWNWSYANSPDPEPSCSIDQGVGEVEQGGISSLVLSGPTTFTLTCTNSAGEYIAQALVITIVEGSISGNKTSLFYTDEDGNTIYVDNAKGKRIPDFSTAGYRAGAEVIPDVPVRISLQPAPGDDTVRIQSAIDSLSEMPLVDGFRGALLLEKGIYEVRRLEINSSGIVIRGEGRGDKRSPLLDPENSYSLEQFRNSLHGEDATILIATGDYQSGAVFRVNQNGNGIQRSGDRIAITDNLVPAGSDTFSVARVGDFSVGDRVKIVRYGNADWISEIGMDQIPPRPDGGTLNQWNPFNLIMENRVTAINGNQIRVKTPVVNAIEREWGYPKSHLDVYYEGENKIGGYIVKYTDEARIFNVGIENLRAISYWMPNENNVDDTRHVANFASFDFVKDFWVNNVTKEHFFRNAISAREGAKRGTIANSSSLIADNTYYTGEGYSSRTFIETGVYAGRYGYVFDRAQQILVENCYTLNDRHSFIFMARMVGPNVFLKSFADRSVAPSDAHQRWSVGGLYDNISETQGLMTCNRLRYGTGQGWGAANHVTWNSDTTLDNDANPPTEQNSYRDSHMCQSPPTAENWSIGHIGRVTKGPFSNHGDACHIESKGKNVLPFSLYYKQLKDRYGIEMLHGRGILFRYLVDDVTVSEDDGNTGVNTIDGDLGTRWSAEGDGHWIMYDLGQVLAISAAEIGFYKGDERVAFFAIQTSMDNQDWTTIYFGESPGNSNDVQLFQFENISEGRYIRYVGYGNTENDWNSVTSFSVR